MKSKKYIFLPIIAFVSGLLLTLIPNVSYSTEVKKVDNFYLNPVAQTLPKIKNTPTQQKTPPQLDKEVVEDIRIDNYEKKYQLNSDYTYTLFQTQQSTLLTKQGVEYGSRETFDYDPNTDSLELIEAYVLQPNGEKVKVASENIFTRSSPESESAPGFTNNMTMTVVFPKLMEGSQTFVKWKQTNKKPSVVGFSSIEYPSFSNSTVKDSVEIELPASLKLNWKKRGNYVVTDTQSGNRRKISAVITNQPGRKAEHGMVSSWDFDSIFVFSNIETWSEIGINLWNKWRDKAIITPEVKKLASQITGDKKGIEAAQLTYNWVAKNIKYLAVYLNDSAGYVPHSTTEILRNGYGDCKDYVLLMHTLLKAKGIESIPVLIDAGSAYQPQPLPSMSFNHAIIYLPDYNIFTDPTNNDAAFDELDESISNKFVVLLTEKGLTKFTPKSQPQNNRYEMQATIYISNEGTIKGESELKYFGNFNSVYRRYFASNTPKQIANAILANTPENGTGIIETSDLNNLDLPITVKGKWNSPYAISIENQVYFNTPVGINTITPSWVREYITFDKRNYPFIVGAANYNWEYKIIIPTGYKITRLPENKDFTNATGSYKSSYKQENKQIQIQRNLIINKDVYSAEEYPTFQDLIYKPINDVRSMIVLEKLPS
jgi:Domain of Unknown Function with PDB structure (DUF3857)/Domain of Unknown Function with PDB structure (DUF3858)/Transglutaminase-like superfamily